MIIEHLKEFYDSRWQKLGYGERDFKTLDTLDLLSLAKDYYDYAVNNLNNLPHFGNGNNGNIGYGTPKEIRQIDSNKPEQIPNKKSRKLNKMRKPQNRVSYTVTFDVLVESYDNVSKAIMDNFLQEMKNHIPDETTIHDENQKEHFTFSRNVKIQKHERSKTERLFP